MEKHYVIREHLNGKKEQVFEGTLKDIDEIQTLERDKEDYVCYENFDEVMSSNFFGDGSDGYKYFEVSEEEYNLAE